MTPREAMQTVVDLAKARELPEELGSAVAVFAGLLG